MPATAQGVGAPGLQGKRRDEAAPSARTVGGIGGAPVRAAALWTLAMANPHAGVSAHSAEYFGDTRDFWWNPDWLALLAQRLDLASVARALDVGCGVGHWGRLLLPRLGVGATLTGIDREPRWVSAAAAVAAERGLAATYVVGDATRLPFDDAQFDLATCQTVLIHVPDPTAVLRELARVTKPGGLVLAVEPNNLTSALVFDSASKGAPVEQVLARAELLLTCERGKVALGEGDNSLGDTLPALFADAGLERVGCWLNDKCPVIRPPYASAEEAAAIDELQDFAARDFWWWSRADTRRYFVAGGGHAETFDGLYGAAMALVRAAAAQVTQQRYAAAVGAVTYVVAGRRPR